MLDLFQHAILREVCEKHNTSLEKLKDVKHVPFLWGVRSELVYRLRCEGKMKWRQIADVLSMKNKEHLYTSAVRYAVLNKLPRPSVND